LLALPAQPASPAGWLRRLTSNEQAVASGSGHFLGRTMISGAHVIVYSKNVDADRAFFRDVLGFKSVDAGHGWLIFALPPAEAAFHPGDKNSVHELYLMCDDLKSEMATLAKKNVTCSEIQEERWSSITKMRLPGGGDVHLYQPKHRKALG
jgi:catechol 2,3-dioxygenase-like lactoylglutathione lyase family enzyme